VSERRRALRFEVSAETLAAFREAMRVLRQKSNEPLDDDCALLLLAREVLAGPSNEGKSSYQIALNICERCGRGSLDARGESIPVTDTVVEMAQCDAQHVGSVTSCPRVNANGAGEETHVGASFSTDESDATDPAPAAQSIPPAIRRRVMRRDHRLCVVPGCRNATFVDLHHIEARADGGGHDADNLVVLCSAHHRAVHRGQLHVSGSVSQGVTFRRSDGARYGALDSPRVADACERAFRGLRGMGFGEREARRAVERTRSASDTETVLRRALALLTQRTMRSV
jgi:hypothetical protein